MNIDNFLDIWDILVNELVGSVWLFVFLGIVVTIYAAAKCRLSSEVTFMLVLLFLSIIFARSNLIILWVFIVLGGGTLFYYMYQKVIRSG